MTELAEIIIPSLCPDCGSLPVIRQKVQAWAGREITWHWAECPNGCIAGYGMEGIPEKDMLTKLVYSRWNDSVTEYKKMDFVLLGAPRTKKNSQRLIIPKGKTKPVPIKSRAFARYERDCLWQITVDMKRRIAYPINLKCRYYMDTRRRVDLVNLLEGTCDILVAAGVLADDNSGVVAGHDGSEVLLDRENPRVEIEITEWRA